MVGREDEEDILGSDPATVSTYHSAGIRAQHEPFCKLQADRLLIPLSYNTGTTLT